MLHRNLSRSKEKKRINRGDHRRSEQLYAPGSELEESHGSEEWFSRTNNGSVRRKTSELRYANNTANKIRRNTIPAEGKKPRRTVEIIVGKGYLVIQDKRSYWKYEMSVKAYPSAIVECKATFVKQAMGPTGRFILRCRANDYRSQATPKYIAIRWKDN